MKSLEFMLSAFYCMDGLHLCMYGYYMYVHIYHTYIWYNKHIRMCIHTYI